MTPAEPVVAQTLTGDVVAQAAERVQRATATCDVLTEADVWGQHGTVVWRAKRFDGSPSFYPVYQQGEYFSYSVAALILRKGYLALNRSAARWAENERFVYHSGSDTIDAEIRRLGGPVRSTRRITECEDLVHRVAAALVEDIGRVEARHPGHTNIILCGGRDSLNLCLLPWKNPTLVLSAAPNFELVQEFVRCNGLDLQVAELQDTADPEVLRLEVLENACRNNLLHVRWGAHLRSLARQHGQKVIFWKGQHFDLNATENWRSYVHPSGDAPKDQRRARLRHLDPLPLSLRRAFSHAWIEPRFHKYLWIRGAMWQGAHMSIAREVADSLVLSAYHGPAVSRVLSEIDFFAAVDHDIRPQLGQVLAGREVAYPATNPGPPPSTLRTGLHRPQHFLSILREAGLRIID